jgi:cob(I)alamin adenosyltransferase
MRQVWGQGRKLWGRKGNLMKIYTKKGDAVKTELVGGIKISKSDQRLRTYGVFDELNALLGLVLTEKLHPGTQALVLKVQDDLFRLGTELATPSGKKAACTYVDSSEVTALESEIDRMEAELTPLKSFILPGGSRPAALLHLARTVCRRSERELALLHESAEVRGEVLKYVNRLSDYLFVAARYANRQAGVADVPWEPRR